MGSEKIRSALGAVLGENGEQPYWKRNFILCATFEPVSDDRLEKTLDKEIFRYPSYCIQGGIALAFPNSLVIFRFPLACLMGWGTKTNTVT